MSTRYINDNPEEVIIGTEGMVFETIHDAITSGVILDLEGFSGTEIKEGHLILKDSNGNYKPMPLSEDGNSYGTAPSDYSEIGLCPVTTSLKEAKHPVGLSGKVNEAILPYALTAAQKTALPLIIWQ